MRKWESKPSAGTIVCTDGIVIVSGDLDETCESDITFRADADVDDLHDD